ncbi:GspE/PulE family protein [Pseudomonas sp. NPDC089569]|uniref:GspE/PulE family protein n=1 Tax=Pseudomonas sp. NPDC089569 TaxID=3390722 RepID=UPI003D06F32C
MTTESILRRQKQILQVLVEEGKVSAAQAAAMAVAENIESIIPDINRLANDENAVASAVGKVLNRKVFQEVEEGRQATLPPNMDSWLIYDNTVYMTNPLDSKVNEQAMDFVRRSGIDRTGIAVGVISAIKLEALRTINIDDDDTTPVDKEAQKLLALQRIEDMLLEAAKKDASDIHLQPSQSDRVSIRYRIDGDLLSQRSYPVSLHDSIVRVVMETKSQLTLETGIPQDGKFDFEFNKGKKIGIRVSSNPVTRGSEKTPKLVLRLLGTNTSLASINKLGLSLRNLEILQRVGNQPNGMILVTGPTGSGKTTLLNAIILDIYRHNPNQNYQTLEDPVEIQHEGMSHTEVTPFLTFAMGLRAILRQDPDVILVGEIRDNETADLAFRGAMTGHLLLSTLHTNNAHDSIGRLERMDIARDILAANTTAIVAQRLVKKLCDGCKKQYLFNSDKSRYELYSGNAAFSKLPGDKDICLYKANPNGCEKCGPDSGGLKGRHAVLEILEITTDIQEAILNGVPPSVIRRTGIANGSFHDLWDDGLRLVRDGILGFEQLEKPLRPYLTDRIRGAQGVKDVPALGNNQNTLKAIL